MALTILCSRDLIQNSGKRGINLKNLQYCISAMSFKFAVRCNDIKGFMYLKFVMVPISAVFSFKYCNYWTEIALFVGDIRISHSLIAAITMYVQILKKKMALEHLIWHFDKKNKNTKNYHLHYLRYIHAIWIIKFFQ